MIQLMEMSSKDMLAEVFLAIATSFLHLLQSLRLHNLSEMPFILIPVWQMIVVYMEYISTLEENDGLLLSTTISFSR